MVTLFLSLCCATYFFVQAYRRGQNPFKWAGIAIAAVMGPLVILGWYVFPISFEILGFHYEGHRSARLTVTIGLIAAGIYLFILARMRLVRYPKLTQMPPPDAEDSNESPSK